MRSFPGVSRICQHSNVTLGKARQTPPALTPPRRAVCHVEATGTAATRRAFREGRLLLKLCMWGVVVAHGCLCRQQFTPWVNCALRGGADAPAPRFAALRRQIYTGHGARRRRRGRLSLCRCERKPISRRHVAVYGPGPDFHRPARLPLYLRRCVSRRPNEQASHDTPSPQTTTQSHLSPSCR